MDKETLKINTPEYFGVLISEMETELARILDFWGTRAIDKEYDGFVGQIDSLGNVIPKASKGAILNARILWTFSAAYRHCGNDEYFKNATCAYNYLVQYFWDNKNGGLIWEVDFEGNPVDTRKQAYVQGFGIYAFSEYYRAVGDEESLEHAKKLYVILEEKFMENEYGGYIEALSAYWTPLEDVRLSPKDYNSPKSMNTHLHILEPYTNLYRVWKDEELKQRILSIIEIFQKKIFDKATGHLNLFFGMDWSVESSIVSFGHDIEGAWLIHEAAIESGEGQVIKSAQKLALTLVESTLKDGFADDGSLLYEEEGGNVDTDRHWWPQAEAMVGLTDVWEFTRNVDYIEKAMGVWRFIKQHMIDRENGEWFWSVHENMEPNMNEDKAGFWKCPYHNSRTLMEIVGRLKK